MYDTVKSNMKLKKVKLDYRNEYRWNKRLPLFNKMCAMTWCNVIVVILLVVSQHINGIYSQGKKHHLLLFF